MSLMGRKKTLSMRSNIDPTSARIEAAVQTIRQSVDLITLEFPKDDRTTIEVFVRMQFASWNSLEAFTSENVLLRYRKVGGI